MATIARMASFRRTSPPLGTHRCVHHTYMFERSTAGRTSSTTATTILSPLTAPPPILCLPDAYSPCSGSAPSYWYLFSSTGWGCTGDHRFTGGHLCAEGRPHGGAQQAQASQEPQAGTAATRCPQYRQRHQEEAGGAVPRLHWADQWTSSGKRRHYRELS